MYVNIFQTCIYIVFFAQKLDFDAFAGFKGCYKGKIPWLD